jgi:hypothetical protein
MMKKLHILLCIFLLLALAPQTKAWEWKTHQDVVQVAFQELPENIQALLNYSKIYDGSTWPDKYRTEPDPYGRTFPSIPCHVQPGSRDQAEYWIEQAGQAYQENDYENASLDLGIAAHIIADSVTLVHNISWTDLHYEYEDQGAQLTPAEPSGIQNFSLEQKLTEYYSGAQAKWQSWLGTRDQAIVQEGVDFAASYTYNAWCQALGIVPSAWQQTGFSIDARFVAIAVLVVIIVLVLVGRKRGW